MRAQSNSPGSRPLLGLLQAIFGRLYRLVPDIPLPNAGKASCELDDLPELVIDANWKLPAAKLPHWLVHDAGPELDQIASDLVATVATEMEDSTGSTRAGEMRNEAGRHRALRFLHRIQRGHVGSTDVVMRSEGKDLYVRVMTKPKTLLTYLRWLWLTALFSLAFSFLLTIYFTITDAKTNWAYEYAQKNASARFPDGNKEDFVRRSVLEGCWHIDWIAVRNKLRNSPSTMDEATSVLIERAWELIESLKQMKLPSSLQDITQTQKAFQNNFALLTVLGIASCAEHAPELWSMIYLDEQENNDEFALWFTLEPFPMPDALPSAVVAFEEDVSYLNTKGVPDPRMARMTVAGIARAGPLMWSEHLSQVDLFTQASFSRPSVERIIRSCARWQRPWSYMGLFMADPRGGLMNVLAPCGIIGSIVGFFVWRSPKSWLRYPCKALGWLTPDDFNSEAIARNGRIVRVLSLTLQQHGFGRESLTELGGEEVPA